MEEKNSIKFKAWLTIDRSFQIVLNQRIYEVLLQLKGSRTPLVFSMPYDNNKPENPTTEECMTYLIKRVVLLEDDVADAHDLAKSLNFDLNSDMQIAHFNAHIEEWERWAKWLHDNLNTAELCKLYEKYDQESNPLKLI